MTDRPEISRRNLFALAGGSAIGLMLRPNWLHAADHDKAATLMERGFGKFKIKDVQTASIEIEGEYTCNLVKVTTDSGLTGIGEARPKIAISKLVNQFKQMVIGEDPLRVDELTRKMIAASKGSGKNELGTIAGIETALWDLAGKILKKPVYDLLGGKRSEGVPLYYDLSPSDTPKTMDPKLWVEWAHFAKKSGYNSMKIDPNRNGGTVPEWLKILEAMRVAVGPDEMKIGLDFHWHLKFEEAFKFVELAEPLDIWFVEDPMRYKGNEKHYQRLVSEGKIPIMAGEQLLTKKSYEDLLKKEMCDLLEVDGQYIGGLLPLKRIIELGKQHGRKTLVHNMCTPVGTYAQAHASVTTSSCIALESHIADDIILHDGPLLENGLLKLNDRPGFGIELNENYCRKRLAKGSKFFGE